MKERKKPYIEIREKTWLQKIDNEGQENSVHFFLHSSVYCLLYMFKCPGILRCYTVHIIKLNIIVSIIDFAYEPSISINVSAHTERERILNNCS